MSVVSIGQDPGLNTGNIQTSYNTNNSDTFALLSAAAGNTVAESLAYAGNTTGAAITAAATNATYSGFLAAGGSGVAATPSALAVGGNNYATGGVGASMNMSTTGGVASDVENILAETATSQAYLIGIQAQLGQQQSTFTAISNALNVKYSMERSAIQNFRS